MKGLRSTDIFREQTENKCPISCDAQWHVAIYRLVGIKRAPQIAGQQEQGDSTDFEICVVLLPVYRAGECVLATEEYEMSKHEFSVAYDGETRHDDHSIDVETLAPALMAFGQLIREANTQVNGKSAVAKVMVVSDFEHKCFNINFEVVLSFIEQIRTLIGTETAKDAKEILEWVGLIGSGGGLSFLGFLKWRNGRKIVEAREYVDEDNTGRVEVRVEGDGNTVHVHPAVFNLSQSQKALKAARDALAPVGQDGFDRLEVRENDDPKEVVTKQEADAIIASCNAGIGDAVDKEPDIDVTPAWLTVYSPVYEADAKQWRFRMGKEVIYADISETNIAEEAIERGGAMVEDSYQVRLEITTPLGQDGKQKKSHYKVLEVLRFAPAPPISRQADIFDSPEEDYETDNE
ncbi:hypothetical protein [Notoacmeibacter sp. MSK16QG-6]|uniref:hypothetical protein n=1 Tax=Notoacmeibacter sp. MSK16QG-6 TaxID=2957982 RepID=UPI00209C88C6|nr:hypothetical protein [Notoacmeibacter sp. MSK16QG-6]MCP1200743.1 hypothetical protein [Notoacmeibacter sp. MSK16QG-6]